MGGSGGRGVGGGGGILTLRRHIDFVVSKVVEVNAEGLLPGKTRDEGSVYGTTTTVLSVVMSIISSNRIC